MKSAALAGAILLSVTATGCFDGSPDVGLAEVRSAITERNFGEAARQAREVIATDPHNPDAYFELARAEALLGNESNAFYALEAAIERGLANPHWALADPAFDGLQPSERYTALQTRASPRIEGRAAAAIAREEIQPNTRIGAGEGSDRVEILEGDDQSIIRAGDVVLETDF